MKLFQSSDKIEVCPIEDCGIEKFKVATFDYLLLSTIITIFSRGGLFS